MIRRFLTIAAVAVGASAGFAAEEAAPKKRPAPFPDFEARWVKPPRANSKQRITVQIDPSAPKAIAPQSATSGASASRAAALGWFWDKVSPDLTQTGPGRLDTALLALATPPSGQAAPVPRLQGLQGIAQTHGIEILKSTVGTRVSPALALAVISVESGGAVEALSSAGAQGLMQLIPATADRFGVTDAQDAAQNIRGGVAYLDWLLKHFDGDPILALAGYNAGENAVAQHDGVPPYAETRDYVPKVLAAFNVARGLCKTPPQLISDGCVFAVSAN